MTLSIQLPDAAAARLCAALGANFNRAALEAICIEAYRRGGMSLGALAETLGMGVIEADKWLGERGAALNYSAPDLRRDVEILSRLGPELPR